MAETILSKLLKKGLDTDPMANIGSGKYGMQQPPQNPYTNAVESVNDFVLPNYLKNPYAKLSAEELNTPNESGKLPPLEPANPLPMAAIDTASFGTSKLVAPLIKAAAPLKAMFFGPMAKTANLAKLAKAKEMVAQGAYELLKGNLGRTKLKDYGSTLEEALPDAMEARDKNIFKETGWLRRPDSKWRTYDPATDANLTATGMVEAGMPGGTPLNKALRYKELYDGYPDLGDIRLKSLPATLPYSGWFSPSGRMGIRHQPNPVRTSTALHETTHGIQDMTGEHFAPGANVESMMDIGKQVFANQKKYEHVPYLFDEEAQQALKSSSRRLYQRHSGEEEAYQTEHLWKLPDYLRQTVYPNEHYLIHPSKQVVPGNWLAKQTPETQEFIKNTMTHQFQGGPPTLENYIKLLMQDAK